MGNSLKIGVVCAEFNRSITSKLENGAVEYLLSKGISKENLKVVNVPGALEIPLIVRALLESDYDGIVALGAVVRGETTHYDYVCTGVERGCSELQLEYLKPVGFGVITVENEEQAVARSGGNKGNKGAEAAEVVLQMIEKVNDILKI